MVIKMYDLDGKEIKIVTDDEIENNKIDDLEDTIDLTKVIEEIKENG
jgi:hypothetical protein